MMRRASAVSAAAFALALAAITGCQSNHSGTGMADITQVQDRTWVAETIEGEPVSPGVTSTLTLAADGRASGSTGCNRYTGPATIDGTHLRFGQLAMTRMACLEPAMAQETRFTQALERADRWSLDGGALLLYAADGSIPPSRFKIQS
jgi:heat shock protein HslJ